MAEQYGNPILLDDEFVELLTACQRDLEVYLFGLVPHRVDAEDLLQEVCMALWRKREQCPPGEDFRRWAFAFALLEVRKFRSKAARSRTWLSDSAIEAIAGEWVEAESFLDDCRDTLAVCLKKLGATEFQVVKQKYGQQQSVKQIAFSSGRPLSTVYKILNRALGLLRQCVERSRSLEEHAR